MILPDSCLMELSRGHKHCSEMNICINNFHSLIMILERTIDIFYMGKQNDTVLTRLIWIFNNE